MDEPEPRFAMQELYGRLVSYHCHTRIGKQTSPRVIEMRIPSLRGELSLTTPRGEEVILRLL